MPSKQDALAAFAAEYDHRIEAAVRAVLASAFYLVEALTGSDIADEARKATQEKLGVSLAAGDRTMSATALANLSRLRIVDTFTDLYVFAFYGVCRRKPRYAGHDLSDIQHILDGALDFHDSLPFEENHDDMYELDRIIDATIARIKIAAGLDVEISLLAALAGTSKTEAMRSLDRDAVAYNADFGKTLVTWRAATQWLGSLPDYWPTNITTR